MYSREIKGELYSFGVSGKLIRNTLVMYDRETESFWSQLLGEAVDGPLLGTELEFVPAVHTTWEEWVELHPDTVALVKGYSSSRDSYSSYYNSGDAGVIGETYEDDRLYTKEFVIGVEHDGEAVAFPFGVLDTAGLVNHNVGGLPVAVIFDSDTAAARVYDRTVAGDVLEFGPWEDGLIVDSATGTIWDLNTGEAISGPLEGKMLTRVKSTASFWFGWKDWFPDTEVYGQLGS